jgi:hypothetical protein
MAKYHQDLSESWYNGSEELENNWTVIENDPHEQSENESDIDPSISKQKSKGNKSDGKKESKKIRRYLKAKTSTVKTVATEFKNMATSWFQKAVGSMDATGMERL